MKTPALRLLPQNLQHWWHARRNPASSSSPRVSELLDNKSLLTVFQPMVDLRTGAVVGHEALIRTPRTVGEWTYEDLLLAAKEQHYQK